MFRISGLLFSLLLFLSAPSLKAQTGLCWGLLDCCLKQDLDPRIKATIDSWHSSIEDFDKTLSCEELVYYAKDYTVFNGDLGELQTLEPLADQYQLKEIYTRGFSTYPRISDLDPLKGLYRLEKITIQHMNIEDLTPLMGLGNIKVLDLTGNNKIHNISALKYLNNLEEFILDCEGEDGNTKCKNPVLLQDLSPLKNLVWLKQLYLKGNSIQDISALAGLENLEILRLQGNKIESLPGLGPYPKLKEVNLSGNKIKGLGQIKAFENAKTLDLSGNPIRSLFGIENLKQAETIRMSATQIKDINLEKPMPNLKHFEVFDDPTAKIDIQNLCAMTSLEDLMLFGKNITDLSGLKECTHLKQLYLGYMKNLNIHSRDLPANLERLDLSGNKLAPMDFRGLQNLKELVLNDAGISHFDLTGLQGLQKLSLGGNLLVNLKAKGDFPNLTDLNLSNNRIKNFPKLSNFPRLYQLGLSGNRIAGKINLQGHSSLGVLWFAENGITQVNFQGAFPEMSDLSLASNKIKRIKGLEKLPSLRDLDLSQNKLKKLPKGLNRIPVSGLNLKGNKLKDLRPLGRLPGLQILEVDNNPIKYWFKNNNLHTLNAGHTGLTSLEFLRDLPSVTSLDVANNNITNLDILIERPHLNRLNLGQNPVVFDFDKWMKHREITHLDLYGVKDLKSIGQLQYFTNLNSLSLGKTDYGNHDVLSYLPFQLERFTYKDAGLENLEILSRHPNISYLYLQGNPLNSLAPLNQMPNLHYLELDKSFGCPEELDYPEMVKGCEQF